MPIHPYQTVVRAVYRNRVAGLVKTLILDRRRGAFRDTPDGLKGELATLAAYGGP